ncbi:unnamed protein product [Rhizoctonia solani]|uniref:Uncharacterized protein n=1 Tax=Rhizoctonia solani TaxID=456999 RepID=A0A8H3GJ34_9AGAM|nr:unnamed protein product [Rhizoctonia solani]
MPFLYDYCPYGTVLSRFVKQSKAYQSAKQYVLLQLIKHPKLSQLAKRLMTTNTQPRRDDVPQDEVTANALSWMIVNCETPRSVDVALQSLAAADESLPTTVLEKCHAWTKIKQRLEYVYMENQSEQSRIGSELYARALEVYPITRRKIDMLGYAYYPLDYVRREERLVLGIQATIQSILDEVLLRIDPKDTTTIQLLNRCAAIGQYHLSHKFSLLYATEDTRERYRVLVEPHTLANDLVNRLEECPRRDFTLYSDMHRALSASLTFLVCCSAAEGLTAGTNTTYALRLIRGYASGVWLCTHLFGWYFFMIDHGHLFQIRTNSLLC